MPNRNTETELEEMEEATLIASQRGEQSQSSRTVPPQPLEGVVRSLIVCEEQGVISSWTFSWLVGGEVIGSQHHQPGSNWSSVSGLMGSIELTSSTQWGLQHLQSSSEDMAQHIIYSLWRTNGSSRRRNTKKKAAYNNFCIEWLNYYYSILLDCFPCSLDFLTSLIKLILWLKFFYG